MTGADTARIDQCSRDFVWNLWRSTCCELTDIMSSREPVNLPHSDLVGRIIEALFDVANELGHGFAEIVYRRSMVIALRARGMRVLELPALQVRYRGHIVGNFYPDLVVDETIVIEVKALREIDPWAEAQLLNYLKAAGGGVGLVVNFGRRTDFKRRVVGDPMDSLPLIRKALLAAEEPSAATTDPGTERPPAR